MITGPLSLIIDWSSTQPLSLSLIIFFSASCTHHVIVFVPIFNHAHGVFTRELGSFWVFFFPIWIWPKSGGLFAQWKWGPFPDLFLLSRQLNLKILLSSISLGKWVSTNFVSFFSFHLPFISLECASVRFCFSNGFCFCFSFLCGSINFNLVSCYLFGSFEPFPLFRFASFVFFLFPPQISIVMEACEILRWMKMSQ